MHDQTPKTLDDLRMEDAECEELTKSDREGDGIHVDAVLENGAEVTDPIKAAALIAERHSLDQAHNLYLAHIDTLRKPIFDAAEQSAATNPYRDIDADAEMAGFRDLLNAGVVAINSAVSAMEAYWRFGGDPQVVELLKSLDVRNATEIGLGPICEIRDALDHALILHDSFHQDERKAKMDNQPS